jgi:hypothetical protein
MSRVSVDILNNSCAPIYVVEHGEIDLAYPIILGRMQTRIVGDLSFLRWVVRCKTG